MLTKEDQDFLGYVDIHCETERALFSGRDVRRLHELAGLVVDDVQEGDFYAMHDDYAKPLIRTARGRHEVAKLPRETDPKTAPYFDFDLSD